MCACATTSTRPGRRTSSNFDDAGAGIVVAEFVDTSITSDFPAGLIPAVQVTLSDNAHIRYFDGLHRG